MEEMGEGGKTPQPPGTEGDRGSEPTRREFLRVGKAFGLGILVGGVLPVTAGGIAYHKMLERGKVKEEPPAPKEASTPEAPKALSPEALFQRDVGEILGRFIQPIAYTDGYLKILTEFLPGLTPDQRERFVKKNITKLNSRVGGRSETTSVGPTTTRIINISLPQWDAELKARDGLALPIHIRAHYERERLSVLHIVANIARPNIPQLQPFIAGPESNNLEEKSLAEAAHTFFKLPPDLEWKGGNYLKRDPETNEIRAGEVAYVEGSAEDILTGATALVEVNTNGSASLIVHPR